MTAKRLGKRILKITGWILALLIVLLVGFHFWFKAHAKKMIEDMVRSKSNGKLELKIGKLHFNYFSKKIELEKAVFFNTDTATGSTAYNFRVDRMKIQARAILPIIFKNQLLIDSLTLLNPYIEVSRLKDIVKSDTKEKKDVSIPEEMGKVYKSIQDALTLLKVKRFEIDNGVFTLINKIDRDQLPLTVSNIYFHIDNLQVDDNLKQTDKIFFSDNVVLVSNNQDILFPDGRHRLSFRNFRINLKKKLVEFDSCTIAASRSDSASASFKVFFDALMLTNIDFDTLYKSEVIKADSVYCLNPTFNLDVEIGKRKDVKKQPPKLENIIQQLTGNLQLGYVVVNNASFNIKTMKDGNPSSFTFSNNNFEMQGLSIDQKAAKPLKVKSFAMAIRNYENFIKDSAYNVKFDSVLLKDNRITLSNFLFTKLNSNGKVTNTFSIPQFNLLGLSWDDLVFERKLKAEQAILFNPHINYTYVPRKNNPGRQTIFQSLGAVNEYMDLQQIDIIDGTIDLKLKNNVQVQLDNATLSVKSHSLLESKRIAGIKNSLMQLRFDRGIIHAGNLDITLNNILYVGKSGQFGAGGVDIINKEKSTYISLDNVSVNSMKLDAVSGGVDAAGLRWNSGSIKINGWASKQQGGHSSILLKDVHGSNTSFNGIFGENSISTTLSDLSFSRLEKLPSSKPMLDDLAVAGSALILKNPSTSLTVDKYAMTDSRPSRLQQVVYKTNTDKIAATATLPVLNFTPDVQQILEGTIALGSMGTTKPVIEIEAFQTTDQQAKRTMPKIDIQSLKISQPSILYSKPTDSGKLSLSWQGQHKAENFISAVGLRTLGNSISISQLNFFLTDFSFDGPKGKKFETGNGRVNAAIQGIQFEKNDLDALEWKANISSFDAKDFKIDSIGKRKGNLVLQSGRIDNLDISSATILNMQQLAAANASFRVRGLTGTYKDKAANWEWSNASFNRTNNTFSLDSFAMNPALPRDSFIAKQKFQKDYMTVRSGAVLVGPVDIDTYIRDKTLGVRKVIIDQLVFSDYKDKRLPFNPGIIKPLTANMIKSIRQKLALDTVLINNARVNYTEVAQKTGLSGDIPVTRMNVRLADVRNYAINSADSLSIYATGYVMDTVWLRLQVKESYTDTLGGFLVTLRARPVDLSVLNPALIPLGSLKITSGYLDTLTMRAIGREYLAWGEMQMYYHDLKVRILKGSNEDKKSFLNDVLNLIANSFVIKNKNTSRTGNVFFIRERDKSAINYLIKMALSGMSSSVGAKNNKKLLRRYKRELQRRDLPPIELD